MANFPPQAPYYGAPYSTFTAPNTPAAPPIGSFQNQQPLPHEQAAQSFQQNAALPGMNFPAFPPPDPAQLAAFWNQVQNGAVMPPFPPPFAHPPSFAPPPPPTSSLSQSYTPFPLPPKPPQPAAFQNTPAPSIPLPNPMLAHTRVMESSGIDREEGEVSEADQRSKAPEGSRAAAQNPQPFVRAQVEPNTSSRMRPNGGTANQVMHSRPQGASGISTGQRSQHDAVLESHGDRRNLSALSPRDHAPGEGALDLRQDSNRRPDPASQSGFQHRPSSTANMPLNKMGSKNAPGLAKQKEEAEAFIKLLYEVGYSFTDLLKEGFSSKSDMLAELYRNLHITVPIGAEPSSSNGVEGAPRSNGRPSIPGLQGVVRVPSTTTTTTRAASDATPNNASTPVLPAAPTTSAPALAAPSTSTAATPKHHPPQPSAQAPTVAPKSSGSVGKAQVTTIRSPDVPLDRADYIKRLMAAKNSKSASQAKAVTQTNMASPTLAKGASSVSTPSSAASPALAPRAESQTVPSQSVPAKKTEVTSTSAPAVEDPAELLKRRKAEANKKLLEKIALIKADAAKRKSTDNDATDSAGESRSENTPLRNDLPTKAPKEASGQPQANLPTVDTTKQDVPALQQPTQPSFSSGIPGLSVPIAPTSRPPSQKPVSADPPSLPVRQVETRKRPVASDFDDLEARPRSVFKKPFGQPRDYLERVVVAVSDDEGSDMDIDEVEGQQQNGFPFSQSAHGMASGAMTPGAANAAEELRKKEAAIASMRRSLALREQQQKVKQLKLSRAPTPATPLQEARQLPPSPGVLQTSTPGTELPSRKESQPPTDKSLSASPHPSADWKTRRRTEIQSGLTTYESEQASSMKRLEELKLEMQRIEAENLKRQKEKADLISELEGLGIDTEGMHHADLQAKKDEIMQQRDEHKTEVEQESEVNVQTHDVQKDSQEITDNLSQTSQHNGVPAQNPEPVRMQTHNDSTQDTSDGEIMESDADEAAMDMSDSDVEKDDVEKDDVETRTVFQKRPAEAAPIPEPQPAAVPAEAVADAQAILADEDSEDFYSPEPESKPMAHAVDDTTMADHAYSDLDDSVDERDVADQDVSMADEEAEVDKAPMDDAAPSERIEGQDKDDNESSDTAQDPLTKLMGGSNAIASTAKEMVEESRAGPSSPDRSMASTNTDDSDISQQEPPRAPELATREHTQALTTHSQSPVVADDLASEIQPNTQRPLRQQAPEVIEVGNEPIQQISAKPAKPPSRSTPYESPLKIFKSYRFSPNFASEVPGGFRSLTYSHKIDPNKPLCTYEAAGGVCNDSSCEFQHFRDMTLSDDHLLVQLGVQPMDTPELDARYRQGLRQVLKELKREKHVKDVEVVASAIAEYRRQFLGDPTRVLVLNNKTGG
ncbi:hypothetical protein K490DRAFT_68268 [Saccharata proteae CBS 121410]|uniref:Putative zinc-finger domain-containing protein n=1 Tax=Saccharata proteae CBS 121410 TaxID=1314787 RepID=A0A9P4LW94_9PEZI|nr:hypothetical protein K490DRAFT_68268 [Saccharata proteae CBS 121410]